MSRDQQSSTHETFVTRRELGRLWTAVIVLAVAWAGTAAWLLLRASSTPQVLAVERLEIVEPDGTLALVMANSQRPAAATIGGQIIMRGQEEERRGMPSIIFFDGKGDEVGGMLFGVRETTTGYSATRHFSLDAYRQDQTVVLAHYQSPAGSTSGLTISDRPSHSLLDALVQLGLGPGATRAQLTAALNSIPEDERPERRRALFGTSRAFFGSAATGEATLTLRDGQGRPRIIIEAPKDGEPSLRMLDASGETVLRLPGV